MTVCLLQAVMHTCRRTPTPSGIVNKLVHFLCHLVDPETKLGAGLTLLLSFALYTINHTLLQGLMRPEAPGELFLAASPHNQQIDPAQGLFVAFSVAAFTVWTVSVIEPLPVITFRYESH